jgi:hypothetical protein
MLTSMQQPNFRIGARLALVSVVGAVVLGGLSANESHAQPGGTETSGSASALIGTAVRKVEVADPQYQMTAFTLEIPANWKFAGTIVRTPGCHGNGAGMEFTAQSPDGLTAAVLMPGWAWSWSGDAATQKITQASKCPGIDIVSAADFLTKIVVPNLRPNAKIVAVLPLKPAGQAALADQLQKQRQQNAAMAQQYGLHPQKLSLEGARVQIQYVRDGHPVEEMIAAVIDCSESQMPALFRRPAYVQRTCFSRGETIARAPQGRLEEVSAQLEKGKGAQINPDWQNRVARDQQAAFANFQAATNKQFQQGLRDNQARFDQQIANGKQFQANLQQSTNQAMAADRARQNAIDASAHATALHSLDRQDFIDPNTGKTIEASNQYNHQWISSDGSTLIQTDDHGYDPNGRVYPVAQSWTELVPK